MVGYHGFKTKKTIKRLWVINKGNFKNLFLMQSVAVL